MSRERTADDAGRADDRRLSLCPVCRRDFVVPVGWDERDETSWFMRLRCGGCGYRFDVIASDIEVDAFCREVDRVLDRFERAAARLERERLEAEGSPPNRR